MKAADIVSIISALAVLITAATALVVALKSLRAVKEVKEVAVDVQSKVNGMHSNSMAREAQLSTVITDGGGTVPSDPNVEQLPTS
jgi:hypothetical protein